MKSSSLVIGCSLPGAQVFAQVIDYLIPNHYLLHGKTAYHIIPCVLLISFSSFYIFVSHIDLDCGKNFIAAYE